MSMAGIQNGLNGRLVVKHVRMAYKSQYDTAIGRYLKDLVVDALT